MAEGTVVEVRPKREPDARKSSTRLSTRLTESVQHACPKVPKATAVTVSEAIDILSRWRRSSPQAARLNGRSGQNSKSGGGNEHWLHVRVDGYDNNDGFTSRYGPVFRGRDYNGIVNFHADAKATAIDHFIDLIDQADDYHDVLRPSATYETKTKPSVMSVRPKFAFQGYKDQVEGFFSLQRRMAIIDICCYLPDFPSLVTPQDRGVAVSQKLGHSPASNWCVAVFAPTSPWVLGTKDSAHTLAVTFRPPVDLPHQRT